jgi:hypothetical protein
MSWITIPELVSLHGRCPSPHYCLSLGVQMGEGIKGTHSRDFHRLFLNFFLHL